MRLIYIITRFLTFPGALTRGFSEQIVCRIHKTVVEDNRYLRRDENCSHIEHELMKTPGSAFAICFVPMFIQLLLAFLVSITAIIDLIYLDYFTMPGGIIDLVCLWVGISLASNCAPSYEDALNMMERLYKTKGHVFQKIIFAPGAVISFGLSVLEKFSVTLLLSVAATVLLYIFI